MQEVREYRREKNRSRPLGPLQRLRDSRKALWLVAAFSILLLWVLSGFLLRSLDSGKVLDGTTMSGVELGGETRVSAAGLISDIEPRQAELSGMGEKIELRAPQAGLVVDADASAEAAYSSGRSGIGAILKGPLVLFGEREVEPVFQPVDSRRLKRTVNRLADKLDREPFVGALSIDDESLGVKIEQPEAGISVRRIATGEELLETFRAGRESMQIPVRKRRAPTPEEVQSVATNAELYLDQPLRIITAGGPATFSPQAMAGVLTVEAAGESADDGIRLGADPEKLKALISGFAKTRDRPARNAGIDAPASPPVSLSEQGDLSWQPKPGAATVVKARVGREVQQNQAIENTVKAIRNDQHQVRFPTERVKPAVSNSQAKGATSLLGTFTTAYTCCEPRVTNIQRMAETVDGTVIGPGEQFSLNGVAGERTRANGYEAAPTIGENNELVDSVGGGVSQFSTTTYNAAYFAGLQIDSHTPHSFYIDRYPAGRESTLDFASIDLLWTNDTDAPVVVRSSASDTSVTVSIYGDNGGRKVKAETQSRSNNDQGGFDITIDRVVIDSDGDRTREPFTTSYGLPAE